ncbi:MAG: Coenzyme F420 hydrogenase/dehydrogenase, beta subunit C-terminal domain [Desulfovibrionaceae bacterium]
MKTFDDLIREVRQTGLCHHCGGCVSFCSAVNYGALELGPDGAPRWRDESRCIECGLCWLICPETGELMDETRRRLDWSEPMGRVRAVSIARAVDPTVRELATDGGVLTALLLHLHDSGRMDSAVAARPTGPMRREPFLAVSRRDILLAAGSAFAGSAGAAAYGQAYSSHCAAVCNLAELKARNLCRVAFVGVPDQILAMRKIQTLGLPPADRVRWYLGLFCSSAFRLGPAELERLETKGRFLWEDVDRVNLKEELRLHLKDGARVLLPLEELAFMARPACRYCTDYSNEYADLSFGGLGAPDGWTVVLVRTEEGERLWNSVRGRVVEEMDQAELRPLRASVLELIRRHSEAKRARGRTELARLHAGGAGPAADAAAPARA